MKPQWKVNTAELLKEVLNNPGAAALKVPLVIFGNLLAEVASRCAEVNDPVLNGLMAQLALYEVTDPCSRQYDSTIAEGLITEKQRLKIDQSYQ